MPKHSGDDSRWKRNSPSTSVCHASSALRLFSANTSRFDSTEALHESQESQISLHRKAVVFEACGNIPVTTADEAKRKTPLTSVCDPSSALGFFTANTSRVDSMEALLESQESQISLNRKAIVFEACRNSPVTTADEKENHRQEVFATHQLL